MFLRGAAFLLRGSEGLGGSLGGGLERRDLRAQVLNLLNLSVNVGGFRFVHGGERGGGLGAPAKVVQLGLPFVKSLPELVHLVAVLVNLVVDGGVRNLELNLQHGEFLAVVVSLILERINRGDERGGFVVLFAQHRRVPGELLGEGGGSLLLAREHSLDALLELVGLGDEIVAESLDDRGHAPLSLGASRGGVGVGSLELSLFGGDGGLGGFEFRADGVGVGD